jgi:hypothetical protein
LVVSIVIGNVKVDMTCDKEEKLKSMMLCIKANILQEMIYFINNNVGCAIFTRTRTGSVASKRRRKRFKCDEIGLKRTINNVRTEKCK